MIDECRSEDDLLELMGREETGIASWRYTSHRNYDLPVAFVFRQHCGSLDIMEIGAWVRFTTNLVRIAERYHAIGGCPICILDLLQKVLRSCTGPP